MTRLSASHSESRGPLERPRRPAWFRPLYPAHRIDWNLACAIAAAGSLGRRAGNPRAEIEKLWGNGVIPFLSVRSALVALMESVNWPPGSEIIVTGVNIGDVPKIIRSFDHVVVPVDIDPHTLSCHPVDLEARVSHKTCAIVVAHLFGGRIRLQPVVEFAKSRNLMLIEDCAQSYTTLADLPPLVSDVRLFSFGLLKTGTVLGGAIAEIADPELRRRMAEVQHHWLRQRRTAYAAKIAKSLLFLGIQRPLAYRAFAQLCTVAGSSSGSVIRKLTRGFGSLDGDELLNAFRRQPSVPLVRMLAWRLAHEDGKRVGRRAMAGEQLYDSLRGMHESQALRVGAAQGNRTHWLVPVSTKHPDALRRKLADAGFDAYGASNVIAIGGKRATEMIDGLVFLPCYPEMTSRARDRVATVIRSNLTGGEEAAATSDDFPDRSG